MVLNNKFGSLYKQAWYHLFAYLPSELGGGNKEKIEVWYKGCLVEAGKVERQTREGAWTGRKVTGLGLPSLKTHIPAEGAQRDQRPSLKPAG